MWYRTYDSDDDLNPRINEVDDSDSDGRYIDGPERRRITGQGYRDNPEPREDSDGGLHPGEGHEDAENWGDNDDESGGFRSGAVRVSGLRG